MKISIGNLIKYAKYLTKLSDMILKLYRYKYGPIHSIIEY